MKKTAIFIAILSGITVSNVASAANSQATMKVEGSIIPATCNINLNGSTSSVLSLGKITAAQLAQSGVTELPNKVVTLNINCPAPTVVGFQVMDLGEKAGQVDLAGVKDAGLFSLGTTKSGAIAGGYFIDLSSGKVDAKNVVSFISSNTSGTNWNKFTGMIDAAKKSVYSWSATSGLNAPAIGLSHQVLLNVHPYINPLSGPDSADKVELRGEATYDLVYL
ncbi:P pilus assembly protein, pilin FimA [Serratia quinivorans]|uniref:DUF1120 domain-containing protein n=1 Tax=Serratia quinivorans TaxID=137545 RepID=UPI000D80EB6A|nr:DUF1120 domain-containing protein [Serratia quinivorans]SPZ61741.1 P pilus assembly protein, pilin FimA [Serratia quinivorans]VEI63966.1 P pilus assembly protein, pilin FimA [Serratia quinivorans]